MATPLREHDLAISLFASGAALTSAAPFVAVVLLPTGLSAENMADVRLLAGLYLAISVAAATTIIALRRRPQLRLLWSIRAAVFSIALTIVGAISFGFVLAPSALLWLIAAASQWRSGRGMGWEIATAGVWTVGIALIGIVLVAMILSPM